MVHVVTFLVGFMLSGFGSWALFDGRMTRVETVIESAHLAEVPSRLATIEANQNTVITLLQHPEDNTGRRK